MKKILLIATISVAGLVSAKNTEVKTPTKEVEKKEVVKEVDSKEADASMQCIQYGMLISCTNEVIPDTVCYGEGTDNATYEDAWDCITTNGQLANEFFCG
ncbi:hypothetical protein OK18_19015 [Chryseobacterium gallinarum]|uniref:Uncharacterized protein n=1 Tax=Chryseobacterium gallinarum TaxID=1324352 RepID=A0A0G3M8W3_CHRGL|nr:hypothetical protein [Chryseobacterium gallinarum]AKK74423.1 hypothetical protein OK18_19015 [Chryseobacterium gallinarum]